MDRDEGHDITERINAFRECARHVWNVFVMPATDDAWDPFGAVEEALFRAIVTYDLPGSVERQGDHYPMLAVSTGPRDDSGDVLYTPDLSLRDHVWTAIELDVSVDCCFMEFFDWERTEARDFRFVAARIVRSSDRNIVTGGGLLIPASRSRVHLRVEPDGTMKKDVGDERGFIELLQSLDVDEPVAGALEDFFESHEMTVALVPVIERLLTSRWLPNRSGALEALIVNGRKAGYEADALLLHYQSRDGLGSPEEFAAFEYLRRLYEGGSQSADRILRLLNEEPYVRRLYGDD